MAVKETTLGLAINILTQRGQIERSAPWFNKDAPK